TSASPEGSCSRSPPTAPASRWTSRPIGWDRRSSSPAAWSRCVRSWSDTCRPSRSPGRDDRRLRGGGSSHACARCTERAGMSTVSPRVNTMSYEAKPLVLDVVRHERQAFYDLIDDPANWEVQTRCEEWQVRDVAGHMIDVTEGYLERWDLAVKNETAPDPL